MNFRDQSIKWTQELAARRNPIKPSTLAMYNSWLRAVPQLAEVELEKIDNGLLRGLTGKLLSYSPATVRGIVGLVKRVVASAVDENGNQLYPRKWNDSFIDLPAVREQKQPVVSAQDIETIIRKTDNPSTKALIALLAGTGMRLGEALALKSDLYNSIQKDGFVPIRATMWRKQELKPKTQAGVREVDIAPALKDYLCSRKREHASNCEHIFPYWPTNLYRQLDLPGFHSLRRFRVSWLRKQGVQESLIQYWMGHANKSITDRYDKTSQDVAYRQEVATKVGLGFNLC